MKKSELVASIAGKAELTKKDTEKFLSAFEEAVVEALVNNEKVQLVGFVTIDVQDRPARNGRNPRTNKPMKIEASRAPRFKAGKTLKDAVNKK